MSMTAGAIVDRVLSVILTCATVYAVVAFTRTSRTSVPAREPTVADPVWIEGWQEELSGASFFTGDANAKVVVLEFMDFECPYCAAYAATLQDLQDSYGDKVAIAIHHYPLSNHRFARLASTAAECARREDRFPEMYKALVARQDSFGLRSWTHYARDSGVTDTIAFAACLRSEDAAAVVESGLSLGRRIGVNATPTIAVNGWLMPRPPTIDDLRRLVDGHLQEDERGVEEH